MMSTNRRASIPQEGTEPGPQAEQAQGRDSRFAPDEFVVQVVEALRHLYEPSSLLHSPLIERLTEPGLSPQRRSRSLRALLLETIEALNPGEEVPFRSSLARSYEAIHLHYIEGHTIEETARYLALSERQAYRDIRRGESEVAALLWQRCLAREALGEQDDGRGLAAGPRQGDAASLAQEIGRLSLRPASVSLREALDYAGAALAPLCRRVGACLRLTLAQDYSVRADNSGLRQCLMAALSYAVQSGAAGAVGGVGSAAAPLGADGRTAGEKAAASGSWEVQLVAEPAGQVLRLWLRCRPAGPAEEVEALDSLLATATMLARAIGGELRLDDCANCCQEAVAPQLECHSGEREGGLCICLSLPLTAPATLVVVDDNEGLPQLIQRYLSDAGVRVLGATDATEGLSLARETHPSAIVLDILMPGTDGWAVLSQLKADPVTSQVPVVVCSVFNDPELAYSLGAAAFVAKPFSRADLLRTLAALGLP